MTAAAVLLGGMAALVPMVFGAGVDADPPRPAALAAVPSPPPVSVTATVEERMHGRPVPARYLGLSFEVAALGQIATFGQQGDMAGLLRSLGPGLLRFGGISADTRTAWTDARTPRPAWASGVLTEADLVRLRSLAERSGWRVLLTVGLAHYDAAAAAREVLAAKRALGPWLAAIEVGNEPDAYASHGLRAQPWTYARYNAEVRAYRRAIARRVRGVALAGPGVSGSRAFVRWGAHEADALRPALLTGHHYPLGCHKLPPPSIELLLSAATRRLESDSLRRYLRVAGSSGIPFRMDELNSVSCGGAAGISNAFASALWATSYIGAALSAGVSGVNLQGNPAYCLGYSPVCAAGARRLARGELGAQPLWYALLAMRGLEGAVPVRARLSATPAVNVSVQAFLLPSGQLRVVLVDGEPPGSAPVELSLRVGRRVNAASELDLTAPSPQSTAGVRLGGRAVAADGSFAPPAGRPLSSQRGVVTVRLAASSAALVTVAPG